MADNTELVYAVINSQMALANNFANLAGSTIEELQGGMSNVYPTTMGWLNLESFTMPPYVRPTPSTTPTPVYEPPTAPLPDTPVLVGVGSVTLPAARTEPVLNTSGLFNFALPSTTMPTLNETEPDLQVDELVAEMDALVTPRLTDLVFPDVHVFAPGAVPVVTLPVYDSPPLPDSVRDPVDYAAAFQASYSTMAPVMRGFVDDKVTAWINTYAPEYNGWVAALQAKVNADMNGAALPDQFEAALYARAQGRIEREFEAATTSIVSSFAKAGLMEPPGTVNANLLTARLKGAEALANQSTDIYIERRKSEIQHAEFVMTLAANVITSARNSAIAYAQQVSATMAMTIDYANQVSGKLMEVYKHLIDRCRLSIDILNVCDSQYNTKLKAALSSYEGYRLQLDAEKARTDLDMAKIAQLNAQIQAEGNSIQKYSALVDSITRKAGLEELKLKEYGIRSDIFGNKIKAQLASFEVYQAAMNGDKSKLDGEMSKLTVFESLVKMDQVNLESQVKQIAAQISVNDAKVSVFKSGADVYKFAADVALQRFTAQAEVKKLAQNIYGQELSNAIDEFKLGLEIPKIMMDALIRQYVVVAEGYIKEAAIEVQQLQVREAAMGHAASAAASVASAAIGALNSVVSSVQSG